MFCMFELLFFIEVVKVVQTTRAFHYQMTYLLKITKGFVIIENLLMELQALI